MSAAPCLVPLLVVAPRYPENRRHLDFERGIDRGMQSPTTVSEVLDRWLSRCNALVLEGEGSPLAASTRDGYGYSIEHLLRELPDCPAEQLRPEVVQAAISRIGRKEGKRGGPYAARSARDTLRAAYKFAHVPMAVLPTEGVRVSRKIQRRDTHVPKSTMKAIDKAADDLAREGRITAVAADAIRFGVRQGMRRRDILALRVENLHAGERWILAWIHKAKKWERIPLSVDSLSILEARAAESVGGWLFPGRRRNGKLGHLANVSRAWDLVLDRVAEMPVNPEDPDGPRNIIIDHRCRRLVFHHLRHAFVSHALAAGVSAVDIARAIGQSNWQSVGAYASAGIEGAREAVDTVSRLVEGNMGKAAKGTVGSRLREAMAQQGMSADDLAVALDVTKRTVYGYMSDTTEIPSGRLPTLCSVLGISADWLLGVRGG